MPQRIEQIIQADKHAREIVEKARKSRDEILSVANVEKIEAIGAAEKKLADLKANLQSENDKYVAEVRAEATELLHQKTAVLDEVYNSNEEKWINDIFVRITDK
ncbi:MAG: hypothetical protein RR978_05095 [Oscillospiraceae bacterium]